MTSPRERFAVWDIVRVAYPYADEVTTRRRPALAAAVPEVHDQFGILWMLMITSARHAAWLNGKRIVIVRRIVACLGLPFIALPWPR